MRKIIIAATLLASSSAFAAQTYSIDGKTVTAIKRCGMEYKATKPHADIMWPQYWSACAAEIKSNPKDGTSPIGKMHIDVAAKLAAMPKPMEVTK